MNRLSDIENPYKSSGEGKGHSFCAPTSIPSKKCRPLRILVVALIAVGLVGVFIGGMKYRNVFHTSNRNGSLIRTDVGTSDIVKTIQHISAHERIPDAVKNTDIDNTREEDEEKIEARLAAVKLAEELKARRQVAHIRQSDPDVNSEEDTDKLPREMLNNAVSSLVPKSGSEMVPKSKFASTVVPPIAAPVVAPVLSDSNLVAEHTVELESTIVAPVVPPVPPVLALATEQKNASLAIANVPQLEKVPVSPAEVKSLPDTMLEINPSVKPIVAQDKQMEVDPTATALVPPIASPVVAPVLSDSSSAAEHTVELESPIASPIVAPTVAPVMAPVVAPPLYLSSVVEHTVELESSVAPPIVPPVPPVSALATDQKAASLATANVPQQEKVPASPAEVKSLPDTTLEINRNVKPIVAQDKQIEVDPASTAVVPPIAAPVVAPVLSDSSSAAEHTVELESPIASPIVAPTVAPVMAPVVAPPLYLSSVVEHTVELESSVAPPIVALVPPVSALATDQKAASLATANVPQQEKVPASPAEVKSLPDTTLEINRNVKPIVAQDKQIEVDPTATACNGKVDPFKGERVEHFKPPVNSSEEEKTKWKSHVSAMIDDIKRLQFGGEKLRDLESAKVAELVNIRFTMFCRYVPLV